MGFEPTRAEPIGLAVQRLNHSATSSDIHWMAIMVVQRVFRHKIWTVMYCFISSSNTSFAGSMQKIPTPGVEPGPPGWKPGILAVRPRGILFPSGIEPETFCVLGRCDNRYTTETVGSDWTKLNMYHLVPWHLVNQLLVIWHHPNVSSRDRLVVRTLRCGRSNPGSNPGHGSDFFSVFHLDQWKCLLNDVM